MRLDKLLSRLPLLHQKATAPLPTRLPISDVVTSPASANRHTVFVCLHTHLQSHHHDALAAYHNGCRIFVTERELALPPDATVLLTEHIPSVLGVLAARCHRHPSKGVRVIGVTGTHGKTSVALLTAALLQKAGKQVGSITSDGISYGQVKLHAGTAALSADDLQRHFSDMRQAGVRYAVVEFTAYMLKHGAAVGTSFFATLLTDLMPHHLREHAHRTFLDYHHSKAMLFEEESKYAILPDAVGEIAPSCKHLIRTQGGDCSFCHVKRATREGRVGISFTLTYRGRSTNFFHPTPALFAAQNAAYAALLSLLCGVKSDRLVSALATTAVPYRMECIHTGEDRLIFLDSAYTGEDLARALVVLRAITKGRLSVLLGSVGCRAKERRAPLGQAALELADLTYLTTDDPDTESPDMIIRDMLRAAPPHASYTIIEDRKAAIQAAISQLKPGDVLLISSKAEPTQLTPTGKIPFSDRTLIMEQIEAY